MPTFFGPAGTGSGSFDEFLARYLQGQRAARSGRPTDITRLLSRRTHEVLSLAGQFAVDLGHGDVDALHILRTMAGAEPATSYVRRAGADPAAVAKAAEERLPEKSGRAATTAPALTPSAQRALLDAYQVARAFGSTYIDPEHLFFALVLNQDAPAGQVLAAAGVTPESFQAGAREAAGTEPSGAGAPEAAASAGAPGATSETPTLDTYGTDLTALARSGGLDPVIGRSDETAQTIEVLARRTKNNPVLIGEAGVGKTAIVEGLAQAIAADTVPEQLRNKRVISLDLPAMLAGTRYRGDFEERLTKAMDEVTANPGQFILFIDELHTVIGAGGAGEGGMDAGNILKPRLARGELHVVGATTPNEYRKVEKDPAFERRFQPVQVGEPSIEDAVQILSGLRERYEEHHGVRYTDEAVRAAVELSARYVTDRFLPDKAIDLIDQAGARLSLKLGSRQDAAGLRERLDALEESKNAAIAAEDFEAASRFRDEAKALKEKLDGGAASQEADGGGSVVVDEAEIAEIISRATGIPASRITEGDRERLARLEEDLHQRVVGQEDAVSLIAKSVRRNRTGMGAAGRPIGSFLFLGPTGVGKTELAKALAGSLFGSEDSMIRFDMSEFGERHTVSRLVGAPPGYVGYDEAGQLTERVRRNPYSIVLLDEVEKAHPDVFNLLLQVLDDGRLTDGHGRTVDFRNTVVIMTSNLGSEFLASKAGPTGFTAAGEGGAFGSEKALRDRVLARLRESMRPEFLNRIDEIVLFRKLDQAQLRQIVRLMLNETEARLRSQGIGLVVSEDAVDWIAERGYEPEYGARPMRRVIQRELDDRIADLLVGSGLAAGGQVTVSTDGPELVVAAGSAEVPLAA
ncbi:ATP-dependent Clp protease ATP-binding subunit ClpC [Arthrobacter sp. PvP023]|uniref:ATP-dependent Clp protease ATP-binding subunit n=1 Tax=Micrococcaceae TaxID=1268 RepID=UPI001AE89FB0|nr:ATP-dependent Clp protease ATP-binding subunit [Arthrobacter sp. PvP023]MBP1134402.1 ATP-dependent Clp protease ATP-binding subunit ClpC [Arthrobacter sp. PvP023]